MGEVVTSWLPSLFLTWGERLSWSSKRRNLIRSLYFNHAIVAVYLVNIVLRKQSKFNTGVLYIIIAYMLLMTLTLSDCSWYGEALRLLWSRSWRHWLNSVVGMLAILLSQIATKLFPCNAKFVRRTKPKFW